MGKGVTQLKVPYDTTDKQLVEYLKKVLPDLLAKKMNIDRNRAEQTAEALAVIIVDRARLCNEVYFVNEISNKILLNAPSKEECEDFKKSLDELIEINFTERKLTEDVVKVMSGKLWGHLKYRVLGRPLEDDSLAPGDAPVGTRG